LHHTEFNWRSNDGLQFYAQAWTPEEEPRAAVALVHGLGEHSGRYAHVAAAMTAAGYALVGFDLRGHGRSEGKRGHSPSWDTLMDDIARLVEETSNRFPGRPVFLYGHSLGGNLVLNYVLQRKPQLAGAIVTSPILRTAFQPPAWKIKLGETLYNLWPAFSLTNEIDPKGISHDSQVVSAYVNDALVHNRVSVEWKQLLRITPRLFDDTLIGLCTKAVKEFAGSAPQLPSGPLHDASEMAAVMPTVMVFAQSSPGISHCKEEDTPERHLDTSIKAFLRLVEHTVAHVAKQ